MISATFLSSQKRVMAFRIWPIVSKACGFPSKLPHRLIEGLQFLAFMPFYRIVV
jgi:hypothetical protein